MASSATIPNSSPHPASSSPHLTPAFPPDPPVRPRIPTPARLRTAKVIHPLAGNHCHERLGKAAVGEWRSRALFCSCGEPTFLGFEAARHTSFCWLHASQAHRHAQQPGGGCHIGVKRRAESECDRRTTIRDAARSGTLIRRSCRLPRCETSYSSLLSSPRV